MDAATAAARDTQPSAQFGYHNTFRTHSEALPDNEPPSYAHTISKPYSQPSCGTTSSTAAEKLPGYFCTTHFEGFLDMRTEYTAPFMLSNDTAWHPVFVVLHGTQLHLHRVKKSLFKSRVQRQGRLIRTYSLQHAEVGIAVDWRKTDLVPRTTLAKLTPKAALTTLYETDPEQFEPVREFVFRLRVEGEQLIFCAASHSLMLDWVEQICAGVDIAPPLEDRAEPRFRSLPRRTRRQRAIEAAALAGCDERTREEQERAFVEEQVELFRRLYPHLASEEVPSIEQEVQPTSSAAENRSTPTTEPTTVDQDTNEFDREDVLGEGAEVPQTSRSPSVRDNLDDEAESYDPKTAPARPLMSYNALCRFRRRCAPILLASSRYSTNVIFFGGERLQVDRQRCKLTPFVVKPPRYDAHNFGESGSASKTVSRDESKLLMSVLAAAEAAARPALARGITAASQWSSGSTDVEHEYENSAEVEEAASVHTTNSASDDLDRIDTVMSISTAEEAPGSPTSMSMSMKGKGKAQGILVTVKKASASPLKPLPRSYNGEDHDVTLAAYAPVLV